MSYFVIENEAGFFYRNSNSKKTRFTTRDPEQAYRYGSATDAARDCDEDEHVSEVDHDGNVMVL